MNGKIALRCAYCEAKAPAGEERRCPACAGPLKVEIAPPRREAASGPGSSLRDPTLPGIWPWFDLLPLSDRGSIVSLREGDTPLVASTRLHETLGLEGLLFKDETRNPTGSFKDRMLSVGVSRAVELGRQTVAVQSSGNVGAAAAAYAARAGLAARILVPRTAPEEKILQARMFGAEVFRVDSDSPADIFALLDWACGEFGWYLTSTAAMDNPFTLEGAKTIAYEIAEQTRFDLPDWLVLPVGGGGNLGSVWRGFLDLRALGLVGRLPRLVGVQAEGCAPFVDAVQQGDSPRAARERRWARIDTVAGAIADDVAVDAHLALPAVRDSGGTAVAVSDADTLALQAALAAQEGLFVEPSSATSLAAVRTLVAQGEIPRQDRVLVLLTGTGLKDPASARRRAPEIKTVALDRRALAAAVSS